jgi:tetratricopeptide (TPR) repeat protein
MRAGNATEAELGFKQVALQYPQFAAPLVDLGLLQRKQGELEASEASLRGAVDRESGNALAWTELGVTQRMRGRFKEAADSYEQAIAADPRYAPAWRNLGVLSDLYLGDPQRALKAFEQYKALTGEDKPVNSWIAELRQRLGIKVPDANPAPPAAPTDAPAAPAPDPALPRPMPPRRRRSRPRQEVEHARTECSRRQAPRPHARRAACRGRAGPDAAGFDRPRQGYPATG